MDDVDGKAWASMTRNGCHPLEPAASTGNVTGRCREEQDLMSVLPCTITMHDTPKTARCTCA